MRFRKETMGLLRRRWHVLTLATLAGHLSVFAVLLVSLRVLDVPASDVTWIEAFAAWSVIRVLGSLPITPGGLGIVELGLTSLLVGFGGGQAEVVAAVLVYRFLTIVPTLLLGMAAAATWRRHHPRDASRRALRSRGACVSMSTKPLAVGAGCRSSAHRIRGRSGRRRHALQVRHASCNARSRTAHLGRVGTAFLHLSGVFASSRAITRHPVVVFRRSDYRQRPRPGPTLMSPRQEVEKLRQLVQHPRHGASPRPREVHGSASASATGSRRSAFSAAPRRRNAELRAGRTRVPWVMRRSR